MATTNASTSTDYEHKYNTLGMPENECSLKDYVFDQTACFALQRQRDYTALDIFDDYSDSLSTGLKALMLGIDHHASQGKTKKPRRGEELEPRHGEESNLSPGDALLDALDDIMDCESPDYMVNQWMKNETLVCVTMLLSHQYETKLFFSYHDACHFIIESLLAVIPSLKLSMSFEEISCALHAAEAKRQAEIEPDYDHSGKLIEKKTTTPKGKVFVCAGLLDPGDMKNEFSSYDLDIQDEAYLGMMLYFADAANSVYYNGLALGFGPHEDPLDWDTRATRMAAKFPFWRNQASRLFATIYAKLDNIPINQRSSSTQEERNKFYSYGGAYLQEFYRLMEEEYYHKFKALKKSQPAADDSDNDSDNELVDLDWLYASRNKQHYELDEFGQLQICVGSKILQDNKKHQVEQDGGYMEEQPHWTRRKPRYSNSTLERNLREPDQAADAFHCSHVDDAAFLELMESGTSYIDLRTMTFHGCDFPEEELRKVDPDWMNHLDPTKHHKILMTRWNAKRGREWICEYCGNSVLPEAWEKSPLIGLPSLTWTKYKQVILDHYTGCAGEAMAHRQMYLSALSKSPEDNWFQGYFTSSCLTGGDGVLIAEILEQEKVCLFISSRQGGFRWVKFSPKNFDEQREMDAKIKTEIRENAEIVLHACEQGL